MKKFRIKRVESGNKLTQVGEEKKSGSKRVCSRTLKRR